MTDLAEAAPAQRRIRFDPTRMRPGRDFGRAQSHSRRVRWMKAMLPAGAAAAIAGFFIAMQFETGGEGVSLAGINIDSKSVTMSKPHISGFEGTRRAYEVKAERALQDLDNPKVVTLETINAKFGLGGTTTATVDATTGVFNGNSNLLTLKDGIKLITNDGTQARFNDARIDIDKGTLVTKRPVEISAKDGMIKANGVEISERGKKVVFSGGVTVTFTPPAAPAAESPAAEALKETPTP